MYDAIVVGARCAGASTAMLLARRGYRVLMLDRAPFPSDTISTHIMWPRGAARLKQWGLLDRVLASGCPPLKRVTFDLGDLSLVGSPANAENDVFLAPRRSVLDAILVDAAIEAGVEFRDNFAVHDVERDQQRVVGIRGRARDGAMVSEHARIVIGADGRNSIIARAAGAREYNNRPSLACWYYTYWSGVSADGVEMISRLPYAIGVIPTNDGLVNVPVACQAHELLQFRQDIESNYLAKIALAPELAERLRQGKREDRFYGMADLPNFFRTPHGPGWALVGDAGYHKDPITAQGISDAFASAESLAAAIDAGFSGRIGLDQALQLYQQNRDERAMPMYEFTCEWASLEPSPPEIEALLGALAGNQPQIDRFIGAVAGSVPLQEFFAPDNVERIMAAMPRP